MDSKGELQSKDWLSLEGYLQPVHNGATAKLKDIKSEKFWFVLKDSELLFYKSCDSRPASRPEGSIDATFASLEIFVLLNCPEGKEYLLSPDSESNLSHWLTTLKTKTAFAEKPSSDSFKRGFGEGLVSKVRRSLRWKKKASRQLSLDSSLTGSFTEPSWHVPLNVMFQSPENDKSPKTDEQDRERSRTFPLEDHTETSMDYQQKPQTCDVGTQTVPVTDGNTKTFESKWTDTEMDLRGLFVEDWVETTDEKFTDSGVAANEDTEKIEQGTEVMCNGKEAFTLQQQKLIRELETEVCRLKCEVVSIIQSTIKVPLKDDDIADWHYVEDIRFKDRIFELLREARYYNPNLPDFDSAKSESFKDSFGFIHGSRESESEVFHYVCRELTQHYSSFLKNKNGHDQLWAEYSRSCKTVDDKVLFKKRELRTLVRDGIPAKCRGDVWKSLIKERTGSIWRAEGPGYYKRLSEGTEKRRDLPNNELSDTERQIKCDLLRSMPNNEKFKHWDSEGVSQLFRVLKAFCAHKPDTGYLQGMNFIVGMFLLVMDEEDAFWSLVGITEDYLGNYFDEALSGVLADQEVLRELVQEFYPILHNHFKYYGVELSTVTFNWFITVYVDAVPFETTLRIWDCFLVEGREILFRIAMGILKLNERSILQLRGSMEIMQFMKRVARVTHDSDRLIKASFEEFKEFPAKEKLDEMQRKHFDDIKAKHAWRVTFHNDRLRSRVSSFTVEIPTADKTEKPDQYQMVECAIATKEDLTGPVCLCCSSRETSNLYLLDIKNKDMVLLDAKIQSRVLCVEVLDGDTVIVGTVSWFIHAFDIDSREELWCIQMNDSVVSMAHYKDGKIFAALADGSICVLKKASAGGPPHEGSHIRVGSAPVTCAVIVGDRMWCGCGNNVVILDAGSSEELKAFDVSPSSRHQVARLTPGTHGVWCSIRGSSWVFLWDKDSFDCLMKVDVTDSDTPGTETLIVSPFQRTRITTVASVGSELWVGLGNGQVLIFDVPRNEKYDRGAYSVIDEQEEQSAASEETPNTESAILQENFPVNREDTSGVEIEREQSSLRVKNIKDYSQEYPFRLRLRVHYRLCEDAIRWLLPVKEKSEQIVFSCASTLSVEGALAMWKREMPVGHQGSYEWIPQPIKQRFQDGDVSPGVAKFASSPETAISKLKTITRQR